MAGMKLIGQTGGEEEKVEDNTVKNRENGGNKDDTVSPVLKLLSEGKLRHCQQNFTQLCYAEEME